MKRTTTYSYALAILTISLSAISGADKLHRPESQSALPTFQFPYMSTEMLDRPVGRLLFTTTGRIEILDTRTGERITVPLPPGMFPSVGIASWCANCEGILFAGGVGLNSQIWFVHPDGTGLWRITDGRGDLVEPDPSPDCLRGVYHPVGGTSHLINLDGTGATDLGVVLGHGRFSPDSRYIAGTDWATPTLNSSVYIYDLATGTLTKILSPAGNNAFSRVDWFPDGSKLVLEHVDRSGSREKHEIWSCNWDGSNPVNLTGDWAGFDEGSPTVAPEGQFILFSSNRDGSFDIWSMRPDGTGRVNLTATPGIDEGTPASFCPALPSDSDGDGVVDPEDECPNTVPGVVVDEHGCSIDQLVPCEGPSPAQPWVNHGAYVSAVAATAEEFLAAGLISVEEKDATVTEAARSHCGKSR